ncbi:GtrA family protein [Taibaiella lutea]|uniref:GtrA family protein n=1 Tax=Taibaiella lutea TaxID=2608001 RepID=A0A5M6CT53_9BACT|nr:GtrA family protein [Taibaiella lutea]KAA5537142.1 GtrA family protein [Taibaiella lutea]
MKTFLKAQATSLISTMVDYVMFGLLHEIFGVWYLIANVIGVASGGLTNFLLGRYWAFSSKEEEIQGQALKFFIVWMGNLILNTSLLFGLNETLGNKNAWISKIVVSIIIGIGYNYVLQKFFVFKKDNDQLAEA